MSNVETVFVYFIFLIQTFHYVNSSGSSPAWFNPSSAASRSISENTASGTSVIDVIATDSEGDVLTYSINVQIPASPAFHLGSTSGTLTSPAGLDAETSTVFTFNFSVTDTTSTVVSPILTINIEDENEFPPVFDQTSYSATIYDTVTNGIHVLTVYASDDDVTSSLSYSITIGDTSTFSIGPTSGDLTVVTTSNLNASSTPSYTLTVQASDGTFTDTATVSITVIDDRCSPNPCQNSGTCSISGISYTCTCQTGWIDQTCSTDDPCLPQPCENSGKCSVSGTTYQCSCTSEFSGTNCTDTSTSGQNNPDDGGLRTGAIVGICISAGLLVCVISAVVLIYSKWSARHQRKKASIDSSNENHETRRTSSLRGNSVSPIYMNKIDLQNDKYK